MVYFSNVSIRESITHYSQYTNRHPLEPNYKILYQFLICLQLSNIIKQILSSLYVCMAIKHVIVLFVETPQKKLYKYK
jgi:hypothetical protein